MEVRKEIDFNKPFTDKQIKMLEEVKERPVQFDNDSPELTDAQLVKLAEAARTRQKSQKKQTVAVRLSPQAVIKAKSLGKGYTTVLGRILEDALADNEIIKHYL